MTRKEVLDIACTCVNGDREQDYGSPENNFSTIAEMWTAYINRKTSSILAVPRDISEYPPLIEAKDVAAMLVLLKVARIGSGNAKADNWVDIAGYAACGGEIEARAVVDRLIEAKKKVEEGKVDEE